MLGKLLLKIGVLLTLAATVEFALLVNPKGRELTGPQPLLKAWRTKHDMLMGPGVGRTLLVGGSNLLFGVDSERIEAVTGRPTINLGLHAGLGLALILNEALAGARSGDLFVLSPEYEHFYGDLLYGEMTVAELIQQDLEPMRFFTFPWSWISLARNAAPVASNVVFAGINQGKEMVLHHPIPVAGIDSIYRADGLNRRGDLITHLDAPRRPDRLARANMTIKGKFNPAAIRAIERAAQQLKQREVRFILVYPAVSQTFWKLNRKAAEQVALAIPPDLSATTPADWVFPDTAFFDTSYHLTRQGRAARTDLLIRVLEGGRVKAGDRLSGSE